MPITTPEPMTQDFGTIGYPLGVKSQGQRVDFSEPPIIVAIESHGYRLAWTRASICPCAPLNDQTEQTNPNCPNCQGAGWLYFGPRTPQDPALIGDLTDTQTALIKRQNAYVIRGLMSNGSTERSPFDRIGGWQSGQMALTVRAENRIGYYDRLVSLDSSIVFNELVLSQGESVYTPLRYYISGGVLLVRSSDHDYKPGTEYYVDAGRLMFRPGMAPPRGTRLAVHYLTYPTWLVIGYPHAVRHQNSARKNLGGGSIPATSPMGHVLNLPLQAMVQLDFLVNAGESP